MCSGHVADPMVIESAASITEVNVQESNADEQPKLVRRLRDLEMSLLSAPREVSAFRPVRKAMVPLVARAAADAVVVEYAGLAPLVQHRGSAQPWLLTLHNLASEMAAQEAAITAGRRQRWLFQRDALAARRWEQNIVTRYDSVIAVSEADAEQLGSERGVKVDVVPNGVDLGGSPTPLPVHPVVVFTGALYTGPNRDGIRWFCRDVWPLVRADLPEAQLLVVGARPGSDVLELSQHPGVEVFADVPETRSYLDLARVAIVPLRIGSGTRLKALESMAAGRPVVGTTIGLGGLGLVDGRHAIFADRPADLAAAITRVLLDDLWAANLASNGRKLVEELYGWDSIGALFAETVLATL